MVLKSDLKVSGLLKLDGALAESSAAGEGLESVLTMNWNPGIRPKKCRRLLSDRGLYDDKYLLYAQSRKLFIHSF